MHSKRIVKSGIILLALTTFATIFWSYKAVFSKNISIADSKSIEVFIENQKTLSSLVNDSSGLNKVLIRPKTLLITAWAKRFKGSIPPGLYLIKDGMSNNDVVNIFRSGIQKPILLTFNNVRTKADLAGNISKQIMADSLDLINLFNNDKFISDFGFNSYTATCPFLPDTYEVYWTLTPKELYRRMVLEYNRFWNDERQKKAEILSLSKNEIITLASIVNEESNLISEQPIIAGLYLNRLKRGYLLQADPTLKFAIGDFNKKRIINDDKRIESPYNTYKYKGLPPGPIRIPTKEAIDAVLNHKSHNYLYMCAKADFSGEHHFSETLKEHLNYAKQYQRTLNKLRIYK